MSCIKIDGGGAENRTPVQRKFLAGVSKLSYERFSDMSVSQPTPHILARFVLVRSIQATSPHATL